eukprot:TRINITY_DN15057_c0_g1_i1.p1 TRINITY_DN15057_c0_g1~~TRINITY_DN15057_c0_g1_i1.p1  ORF type:complete len:710 (+),score=150.39 TRINITY_DN15057_c0_g1_i1:101-2230(+)
MSRWKAAVEQVRLQRPSVVEQSDFEGSESHPGKDSKPTSFATAVPSSKSLLELANVARAVAARAAVHTKLAQPKQRARTIGVKLTPMQQVKADLAAMMASKNSGMPQPPAKKLTPTKPKLVRAAPPPVEFQNPLRWLNREQLIALLQTDPNSRSEEDVTVLYDQIIKGFPIIVDLSGDDRKAVCRHLMYRKCAVDEMVFQAGSTLPHNVYLIWSGSTNVILHKGKRQHVTKTWRTGHVFGETVSQRPGRHISVQCRQPTELIYFPQEEYEECLANAQSALQTEKLKFLNKAFGSNFPQLNALCAAMKKHAVEKNKVLVRQGQKADALFFVISGQMLICKELDIHVQDDGGEMSNRMKQLAVPTLHEEPEDMQPYAPQLLHIPRILRAAHALRKQSVAPSKGQLPRLSIAPINKIAFKFVPSLLLQVQEDERTAAAERAARPVVPPLPLPALISQPITSGLAALVTPITRHHSRRFGSSAASKHSASARAVGSRSTVNLRKRPSQFSAASNDGSVSRTLSSRPSLTSNAKSSAASRMRLTRPSMVSFVSHGTTDEDVSDSDATSDVEEHAQTARPSGSKGLHSIAAALAAEQARNSAERRLFELKRLTSYDFFGEQSLLPDVPSDLTLITSTPCEVWVITARDVKRLVTGALKEYLSHRILEYPTEDVIRTEVNRLEDWSRFREELVDSVRADERVAYLHANPHALFTAR